jgi:VWFA-related protein
LLTACDRINGMAETMSCRFGLGAVLLISAHGVCAFQAPVDAIVLKSNTRVVQISVSVRDASGHPVRSLRKEDFVVLDNGHPRDIQVFSSEAAVIRTSPLVDLPPNTFTNRFGTQNTPGRITVIAIDAVLLSLADQGRARAYVLRAIARMGLGDLMAVYALCPDLRVIQDYTAEPQQALRSLNTFLPIPPPPSYSFASGKITAVLGGLHTVATHLASAPGRKAVVWLSPGFEPPARIKAAPRIQAAYDETVRALNDSNTELYQVDPAGVERNSYVASMMEEFTGLTGGRVSYEGNAVDRAILAAMTDTQYAYEMGFYLSDADYDGKFHPLEVRIPTHSNFDLHFRHGYTASLDIPSTAPQDLDLNSELLDPVDPSAIRIDAALKVLAGGISIPSLNGVKTAKVLEVSLAIDPQTVTLTADETGTIEELMIETDVSGRELIKAQEELQLIWPAGHPVAKFRKPIELKEGATTLRVVIRDKATGRIGSLKMSLASIDRGDSPN